MRVKMIPGRDAIGQPNGISRVIEKYYQHGAANGIEFVDQQADLIMSHAGATGADCDVAMLHGLYFTGDYQGSQSDYHVNARLVQSVRSAKVITVPSPWVAEIIQRDMRIDPVVVPHGIDWQDWQHTYPVENYVLYNKNRDGMDVCNSNQVAQLAEMAQNVKFVSTHCRYELKNVQVIGLQPHFKMKPIVQKAAVYLSLTKETFGIGILEAMASGVPVLGWNVGGNVDLIRHGVNGYLAEYGDYADLRNGLEYCLNNRRVLGANGVELAKTWTWDNALLRLRIALETAMLKKQEPASVSVVIPVYNYGHKVARAVDSVLQQTYSADKVVLVDDGSSDDTYEVIRELASQDPHVLAFNKANGGVATARNFGFEKVKSKYVCFLDADDALHPEFLKTCVTALEKDPSLYIAYTGLHWIKPDGSEGESKWPGDWHYDAQLSRQNQVPTCCVMRREVMERLGGYRQRYAPEGAGSEDADLFTRAGAYGMKAQKVDNRGLFIYSWLSGATSQQNYSEVDWLGWHPWVKHKKHPFASYATPENQISHPVYQYDEPAVSVVIPVGQGHEQLVVDALDSLDAQTYRKWEAILVIDSDSQEQYRAYPHTRLIYTPKPGSGPGVARNMGAQVARGKFLLFLDADDWLEPSCLERMIAEWKVSQGIVYTDYYGLISTDVGGEMEVISRRKKIGRRAFRAAEYDCVRAQQGPNSDSLFHWCLVTCLIPKAWHVEIGGFDEKMESWEDVDYHWRMAQMGKCYVRLPERLVSYRFTTGTRRQAANLETNKETASKLLRYLRSKYERITTMPCTSCGGSRTRPQTNQAPARTLMAQPANTDNNYVMIIYKHPNKGEHPVIGPATGTNYGYRAGGDQFLVRREDTERMPDLFVEIGNVENVGDVPSVPQQPLAAPQPLAAASTEPVAFGVTTRIEDTFDIQTLPGIIPSVARQLIEQGVTTRESFLSLSETQISQLEGVGKARAKAIMNTIAKMREEQ